MTSPLNDTLMTLFATGVISLKRLGEIIVAHEDVRQMAQDLEPDTQRDIPTEPPAYSLATVAAPSSTVRTPRAVVVFDEVG